ncbi:hypothetical protein D3C85_1306230 [compost metagenome]
MTTAIPPGIRPWKMAAFSRATPASPSAKASMCTGPTVVTQAAWGRTKADSGPISPGWFMPISNTARSVPCGIRASVRGTPIWLL